MWIRVFAGKCFGSDVDEVVLEDEMFCLLVSLGVSIALSTEWKKLNWQVNMPLIWS